MEKHEILVIGTVHVIDSSYELVKIFYDALNETAMIIAIPSLPDNPDELLQKNSLS